MVMYPGKQGSDLMMAKESRQASPRRGHGTPVRNLLEPSEGQREPFGSPDPFGSQPSYSSLGGDGPAYSAATVYLEADSELDRSGANSDQAVAELQRQLDQVKAEHAQLLDSLGSVAQSWRLGQQVISLP